MQFVFAMSTSQPNAEIVETCKNKPVLTFLNMSVTFSNNWYLPLSLANSHVDDFRDTISGSWQMYDNMAKVYTHFSSVSTI